MQSRTESQMLFASDLPKFACNWFMPEEPNLWLFVFNAEAGH